MVLAQWSPVLVPETELPLRVNGRDVVGRSVDKPVVNLFCVNWYGSHQRQLVPNGLNRRPVDEVAALIVDMQFNCVRFPYSLDMMSAREVPNATESLKANPGLQQKTPLQVYDATINSLTDAGLLVILNNHVSKGMWCCNSNDGEGLWYTDDYNETVWLKSLEEMAGRYRNNSRVVGFDLRNELRASHLGSPTWGTGDVHTDWSLAAAKGAKRVIAANEEMLIFISGLDYGLFLCDVAKQPLHLQIPALRGRTVYTAHEYSWYYSDLGVFNRTAYYASISYLLAAVFLFSLTAMVMVYRRTRAHGINIARTVRSTKTTFDSPVFFAFATVCQGSFFAALTFGERIASGCGKSDDIFEISVLSLAIPAVISLVAWVCSLYQYVVRTSPGLRFMALSHESSTLPNELLIGRDVQNRDRETMDVECELVKAHSVDDTFHKMTQRKVDALSVSLVLGLVFVIAVGFVSWRKGGYDTWAEEFDARWGFLLDGTSRSDENSGLAVPVWIGEFGTADDDWWWQVMTRYMRERHIGWAYWPLNGEKRPGEGETYGLLMEDMRTVRHPWKLKALQEMTKVGWR